MLKSNFTNSKLTSRLVVNNIVATSDLQQKIDVLKFVNYPWGIYDEAIYGGVCGYLKSPEMKGKVTVFANGKLISVGTKTISDAKESLYSAKFYLLQNKLIQDVYLKIKVVNIVATLDIGKKLNLLRIKKMFHNTSYASEQFPGLILQLNKKRILLFPSGKIILTGLSSMTELKQNKKTILNMLNHST